MIRYSRLTDEQRDKIVERYKMALALGATDVKHAAAIAAHDILGWKGRKCKRVADRIIKSDMRHAPGPCPKCDHDSDAYAVALTVIIHNEIASVATRGN